LVSVDHNDPINVVDRQLWRDAQDMLLRHVPAAAGERCDYCGRPWPCTSRRVGERAEVAAFKPWNEAWTIRNDLVSLRGDMNTRTGGAAAPHPPVRNRGAVFRDLAALDD
jgi:hypothetical protein